jgi:hypothetical protein
VADNTASYQKMNSKTQSHHSFFHSSSKTTKDFYSYNFEKNYSMALSYKYIVEHSVTVVPTPPIMAAPPTREFQLATLLLPKDYDKATYRQFIDTFGTHYMSQAFMGGSALLTNYFHSCFLGTYSMQSVTKASSSSFFGVFNSASGKGWGSSINKTLWNTWSDIDLKLNGGNGSAYGTLGLDNKMSESDVASWQSSLDSTNIVPLTYSLEPITAIMTSDWIDASIVDNVKKALDDYDADVGAEMQQLQDYLVSKDNYTTPSWCKVPTPPTPPSSRRRRRKKRKLATSLPGCPALPPVPPLDSSAYMNVPKRGLRAAVPAITAASTTSTDVTEPTHGPIPGLVSASGELGSLFGRGYDPVESVSKGAISEWHYDGWACRGASSKCSADAKSIEMSNTWYDPSSGLTFRKPDEIQLFNTPSSHTDGGYKLFLNSTTYNKWHFSSHSTSIGLGFFQLRTHGL